MKIPGQESISVPVYNGNESVSGKVDLIVPSGKKFEHLGIKIEMIGHIGERDCCQCNHQEFFDSDITLSWIRIIF